MRALFTLLILLALPSFAQDKKKVRELQHQKQELQEKLRRSQQELDDTRQAISSYSQNTLMLQDEMEQQLEELREGEQRLHTLDMQISSLQGQSTLVDERLQKKKEKFARALRMARAYRHFQSPTLFVLSAKTLTQMRRRVRNTNFFALVLRTMGEELVAKHAQLLATQNDLLEAKSKLNNLLKELINKRNSLGMRTDDMQEQITNLSNRQHNLESLLTQQRNQLSALNRRTDEIVAAEAEAAKRKAEKERKCEEKAKKASRSNAATGKGITAQQQSINSTFKRNKGRLPIPITGAHTIGERMGSYKIPGAGDETLTNKGTNYIGKAGAKARCIFDGEVTEVFRFYNTKGVLIRHGSYISLYCNLSSVIVNKGQKVHARDLLGTVATNENDKAILHFQLRHNGKELNPEAWISK